MKIIANAGKGNLLVLMSDTEIMALTGMRWRDADRISIGAEFDLRGTWANIDGIRSEMEGARRSAANLRALADMVEREVETLKVYEEKLPAEAPDAAT